MCTRNPTPLNYKSGFKRFQTLAEIASRLHKHFTAFTHSLIPHASLNEMLSMFSFALVRKAYTRCSVTGHSDSTACRKHQNIRFVLGQCLLHVFPLAGRRRAEPNKHKAEALTSRKRLCKVSSVMSSTSGL